MKTTTKPKSKKPKAPGEIRKAGYERNMQAMREFKANHPCLSCGRYYPEYVMDFALPKEGEWSIGRLAGSRCTLAILEKAMADTQLFCANCLRIVTRMSAEKAQKK